MLADRQKAEAAQAMELTIALAQTPLQRLEHTLQPWASLVVMPLFALANTGVLLQVDPATIFSHVASLGIMVGLVIGKPGGIILASWICVRTGFADLPTQTKWPQLCGVSLLAGIGFTMSLFIANLAFRQDAILPLAKIAILIASLSAGVIGWILLSKTSHKEVNSQKPPGTDLSY